jgi:predicted deacylase
VDSSKHGNESSGIITKKELLAQLSDNQVLKKDRGTWSE